MPLKARGSAWQLRNTVQLYHCFEHVGDLKRRR